MLQGTFAEALCCKRNRNLLICLDAMNTLAQSEGSWNNIWLLCHLASFMLDDVQGYNLKFV